MISGDRYSAAKLDIVFKVRACRNDRLIEDRLTQRDQAKSLQNRLRIGAGGTLVGNSPPEEVNQRQSERGGLAFDFLRLARQIRHAETSGPAAPLRHHVNEDIDVDENLQSVSLRATLSRISSLSFSTGVYGWIPTRARRSGSMGTLGQGFDSSSRSVSPCRVSAASRSFCSRSESSRRSSSRSADTSSLRRSLSNSSTWAGVFPMMVRIIDGDRAEGQVELDVSLNAAKQIGLTIPPNVLVRADRVVK